jgi:hypothetical protein
MPIVPETTKSLKMRRDIRFSKSLQSQDLARRLNFQANKCMGP